VVIVGFLRPESGATDFFEFSNVFLGDSNLFSIGFIAYLRFPNLETKGIKDSLVFPIFVEEPAVNDSAFFFIPNNFGILDIGFFSFSTSS